MVHFASAVTPAQGSLGSNVLLRRSNNVPRRHPNFSGNYQPGRLGKHQPGWGSSMPPQRRVAVLCSPANDYVRRKMEKEWLDAKRDFEEQKANPYTPQWYEILLEKLTPAALKNVPGSVARTWWLLTIGGSAMLTLMIYH